MTFSSDRIPATPVFVVSDPESLRSSLLESAAALLGKDLYPAQVEYLLCDLIAYVYSLAQIDFQYTGEQSLVNFALGGNLEQLGALLGVTRAEASQALTTFQFTLSSAQTQNVFIQAGTRIKSKDGRAIFETTEDLTIVGTPTNAVTRNVSGIVRGRCQTPGVTGNQYQANDINLLVDPVAFVASVTNITIAAGGIDAEDDERLRTRTKLAPASFSVAGPEDSYRFYALRVSPAIRDVSVVSPNPNAVISALQTLIQQVSDVVQAVNTTLADAKTAASTRAATNIALVQPTVADLARVRVYVLATTGLPSNELKALVATELNALSVRPLTDLVEVLDPVAVPYTVTIQLTIFGFADQQSVLAQATAEVAKITSAWGSKLGADIVPEQLVTALVPVASQPNGGVYGVYRAVVVSPTYQALAVSQWASLSAAPTITIVGSTNG